MKSQITKLLIFTGLVFILFSCSNNIEDLSQENAEFVLNEYDTLVYFYNQTDTCKVSVKSYFSQGYVEINHYSLFNHVLDDFGGSRFCLPDSIYQFSMDVSGKSDEINLWFNLYDKKSIYYKYANIFSSVVKKSELTKNITIQNINYIDCYSYNLNATQDSNRIGIQSFVFNKQYGLVQLIMRDSTKFDLIGAK